MEKRTSKRIPVNLLADLIRGDISHKVFIADISKNGLFVIAVSGEEALPVRNDNEVLTVKIHVSPGQYLELRSKEVWSDASEESARKMGLAIEDPPGEFKKFYKSSYYKVKKEISHDAIAVVGMACHYPGATNLKSFWENILARRREFRRIPERRLPVSDYYDPDPLAPDKTYANRAAVIDGFEFDWAKRGIPKSVVESSDIVHWLALEVALRALEDARYNRENIPSDRTGVILGNTLTGEHSRSQNMRLRWPYVRRALMAACSKKKLPPNFTYELIETMESYYKSAFAPVTEDTLAGNLSNTIAGRICNFLDLRGGGYTVDGACSSSLIAVATAATGLSNGTLDLAVAGGIDISLDTFELVGFAKTNALTKEDMRVYDQRASGFIPGEGSGFVVLKRLEDARADGNYIYAVLRGWGISSDGKGGMTAPKAKTQALAIRRAYGKAGYGLDKVDFIEGHGTGTVAGDKAELEGIAEAMDEKSGSTLRSCGITSLKSLIGHTKAASGIGGFIKAVIAVNRRVIPPTAGCRELNAIFREKASMVFPVLRGEVRKADEILRAGISGMGFGGINCHVTVESAGEPARSIEPTIRERELFASYQETELFVISAPSQREAIERINHVRKLANGISTGEIVDLSRSLARKTSAGEQFRSALIAGSPDGLLDVLDSAEEMLCAGDIPEGQVISSPQGDVLAGNSVTRNRVGFLFPGQGSQQLNMGRLLIERYPWARDIKDRAELLLSESGCERIGDVIFRPIDRALDKAQIDDWEEALSRSEIAQPAMCLTSLLWVRHLENLGVRPVVAGGHSLGELMAFHAAGAFDDNALLRFAALRGKVASAPCGNGGVMASFACGREQAERILKDIKGSCAVVANINSPTQTVISGEREAVEKAVKAGTLMGIRTKYLPVANAFHSRFMSAAAGRIYKDAPIPELMTQPTIELFTSMDGSRIRPGINLRRHFAGQVTHQVDFVSLVNNMANECDLLVEVGPGRVLSDLVKSIVGTDGIRCLPVESKADDAHSLNILLGHYFTRGGEINWPVFFENRLVRRFVPASERTFIDNPCERPFVLNEDVVSPDGEELPGGLLKKTGESAVDAASLFSGEQVEFIRKLIHAEAKRMSFEPDVLHRSTRKEAAPIEIKETNGPQGDGTVRSADTLLKLASEMTGFPEDSISLEHRLLDNLNLDSIKAGQFVARAAKLFGAAGKLDPTTMANSSLREIFDLIGDASASGRIEKPELANRAAQLAEKSLIPVDKPDNLVRDFRVSYIEELRVSSLSFGEVLGTLADERRHVLIVSDNAKDRLASRMLGILTGHGIPAELLEYKSLSSHMDHRVERFDYFVFLLPRKMSDHVLAETDVHVMASRMQCIAAVISRLKTRSPKPAHAIVQFGKGGFHKADEGMSIEAKGSAAFMCSVHLENPTERIRVMEFAHSDDAEGILCEVVAELRAEEAFRMAVFDSQFVRRIPVFELAHTGSCERRNLEWTRSDVVLVTGGARGITAECALAFAVKTGVKLALVGTTVLIDKDEEIQRCLRQYRENGVEYRYYACDISEKSCVVDLKKRIERDLGVVTGIIHGAAVNRPRRAEQVDLGEAMSEIAPKIVGAINICSAFRNNPPKIFAAFGSIIGITGMMGNAWYGFSNEILNLVLQQFESHAGTVQAITIAFSVWDEVGMGTRMGSLEVLSGMGILPISKKRGVSRFMELMERSPGENLIIVTSKLAGLDTVGNKPLVTPEGMRFLEGILVYEEGVEVETKATLSLDKDPYIDHHVFKGSYLFPTVFGIEAMAQSAMYVSGLRGFDSVRLENVRLSYPITVEPGAETEIRVRALVEDTPEGSDEMRVSASIMVDQTAFSRKHFEATFVFLTRDTTEHHSHRIPDFFLDIKPEEDLYGHMLFQGEMFQRIRALRMLTDSQCAFDSAMVSTPPASYRLHGSFVAGDPFFRDTLLQSGQLMLADVLALPIEIERWDIYSNRLVDGTYRVISEILQKSDDVITSNVIAIDEKGTVVERLQGYRAKVVEKMRDAPSIGDLVAPDHWDESKINDKVARYCRIIRVTPPSISIRHQSGLHEMAKTKRHIMEKELFERAYRRLKAIDRTLSDEITVAWADDGKPFARCGGVGLSCTHDDRLCLCTVGRGQQGCDVEITTHRSEEQWRELLGIQREPLLQMVSRMDKSIDRAGSRLWCALEALRKAAGMGAGALEYARQVDDCLVFTSGNFSILTFPVRLLRGSERMIALAVAESKSHHERAHDEASARDAAEESRWGNFVRLGEQGQKMFTCRFPVGMKDSSAIGGGVYFASYFHWLGKIREMSLKPIGRYISDEVSYGRFMVTNYTGTEISSCVRNHEDIDARVWIKGISGVGDSSLLLHFEWRKRLEDGSITPVAFSRQQVSWVKSVGHGVVEPIACPAFFMDYLRTNDMLPAMNGKGTRGSTHEGGMMCTTDLGDILYEDDLLGENNLLGETVFDTTMEQGSIARNIYFSNYFSWQGHLRDRCLFNLSPARYLEMDGNGRFACIHSTVSHLQEAIPFDRVKTSVKLRRLQEFGLDLYFEYFKATPDGGRIKLAYGAHTVAWVRIDSLGNYVREKIPAGYITQILKRVRPADGQRR